MLPAGVTIVGVVSILVEDDALLLRLLCSDGSIAATWWPLDDLHKYCRVVEEARRPLGAASLQ